MGKRVLSIDESKCIDETVYTLYETIGVNKVKLFSTCDKELFNRVSKTIERYYKAKETVDKLMSLYGDTK